VKRCAMTTQPRAEVGPVPPGYFTRCETCAATLKTPLDWRLHTNGTGVCTLFEGVKPRRSPLDNL